jgi:hypothetical protein
MKNKFAVKSNKIKSYDTQIKDSNEKSKISIEPFMNDYFRGKISPSHYLSLIKQYKE